MTSGRVLSINTSPGGVPKTAVREAHVSAEGLVGDRHRSPTHGGRDRAVVLYSIALIEALQAEGHPIDIGTTGENLTLDAVDWSRLVPGVEVEVGGVRLAITAYTKPCPTIGASFLDGNSSRIGHDAHPGWSRVCARVLREGRVRAGDPVRIVGGDSQPRIHEGHEDA